MKEATRQFYLEAMGVTLWYPRQALPGAAPSPDLDFSTDEPAVTPSAVGVVADVPVVAPIVPPAPQPDRQPPAPREAPVARAPNLSGLMREAADPPRQAPEAAPVATVPRAAQLEASAPEPLPSISIYCALWIGHRYAVLADLDAQVSIELQQKLIRNLLRALGDDGQNLTHPIRFHQVRWPVFANPLIPGNGVDGLKVVLGSLLPAEDEHAWIVLGEESGRVIDAGVAQPRHLWLREDFRPADMAADSQLKRRLWLRIQEQQGAVS